MVEAKSGLAHQLEAFAANTIEFMRRERSMLLDGIGIPELEVELTGRQVLVVAAGFDHEAELRSLKGYIREYRPVLVGVGAGADALRVAGYTPDLIVGDPAEISNEALTSGADVVVPAFADGHAPGPAPGAGPRRRRGHLPQLGQPGGPGAAAGGLPRRGAGGDRRAVGDDGGVPRPRPVGQQRLHLPDPAAGRRQLVDARTIALLYRSRLSIGAILLMLGAVLVAVVAALLVSDAGDALLAWFQQLAFVTQIESWFGS